jgi:taurine dioxygenase
VEIRELAPTVGAEIHGVDLSRPLEAAQLTDIRRAFHDYGVIFFRDQELTPEQHIAFAKTWSGININRFFRPLDGHPEIAEVLKEAHQVNNIGGSWHTDHSYDEAPAMGSILYARELPETGGDTLFASMHHAYEALSDGMKSMLGGLRAVHSSRHVYGPGMNSERSDTEGRTGNSELAIQETTHPVVLNHPDNGRMVLYVNPGFTTRFDGWTEAESKPLLEYLYSHAVQPEFVCRFRWRKGSLAFWDNRATWHYAINDYGGQRRLMHRITLEGVPFE